MSISFEGKVAIVTGGGNGLGREYCLRLAERGAKVVVNDLGGTVDGTGQSIAAADQVVGEIKEAGGIAISNAADVTSVDQVQSMVDQTIGQFGRIDILINNAGILRDKSFAKMNLDDFKKVVDVHLYGTLNCTKAVWPIMKEQGYGRIVMTSSSSGIYGNFGQCNYGAAKAAMVGMMNVLHQEGAKSDIRVNCLAPAAATRMLDGLLSEKLAKLMDPALVAPGVLYLVSDEAPSKTILAAGGGGFAVVNIYETVGAFLGGETATVDDVAANWEAICATDGQRGLNGAFDQTDKFASLAAEALGISLSSEG